MEDPEITSMTNEIDEIEPSDGRIETNEGDLHLHGQSYSKIMKVKKGNMVPEERISRTKKIDEKDMEVRLHINDPRQDYSKKMKTKKAIQRKTRVIFLSCCVLAFSLDPLFFYIPIINNQKKCLRMDEKLKRPMLVLRSVMDLTYIFHSAFLIFYGDLAYNSESRRLSPKSNKFIDRTMGVIRRNIWWIIIIDILCVLPIPQVVIFVYFSKMRGSESLNTRKFLNFLVLLQFVPRIFRIYLSCKELTKNLSLWAKGLFNLFLYVIASHVVGALWYFFSVQRESACWQYACKGNSMCNKLNFFCDSRYYRVDDPIVDYLNLSCPLIQPSHFDFGMFTFALQSGIVNSMDFPKKFFYCFAWGLRNLSSFGSNLQTSTYFWENLFSAAITIIGLLLFLYLIGNLQTYLQFSEQNSVKRREKMKTKQVEIDNWIKNNETLLDMREEIVDGLRRNMKENEDVNLKNILNVLPTQSQKRIKKILCLPILKKVEHLKRMDDKLIDEVFIDRLKPVIFNENSQILKEGDTLDQMLFFTQGSAGVYHANTPATPVELQKGDHFGEALLAKASKTILEMIGSPPTPVELQKGDFYGEDLLMRALIGLSSPIISSKTVKAHTKVEAFALEARYMNKIAKDIKERHPQTLFRRMGLMGREVLRMMDLGWRVRVPNT